MRLSWTRKLLFSGIIAALSLFVIELGTRAIFAARVGPSVFWYGFSSTNYNPAPRDPNAATSHPEPTGNTGGYIKYAPSDVRYDHDPETGEGFEVTINSHGFRGPEWKVEKAPGVIRVVTLGASSTFGYTDRENETYPYYMQVLLNERAMDGRKYEVINLGIPHERSDQILALFLAEALPLHPDVVTFYEGVNDSKYGTAASAPEARVTEGGAAPAAAKREGTGDMRSRLRGIASLKGAYRAVRDHLLVVSFVDSLLLPFQPTQYSPADVRQFMAGKSEAFIANVARISGECRTRGIIFLPATQQAKSEAIERGAIKGVTYAAEVKDVEERLAREKRLPANQMYLLTHSKVMDALRSWASAQGVPLVDVIHALDGDRDVLVSWVHLSPKGNRIVAQAFVDEILRQAHAPASGRTF